MSEHKNAGRQRIDPDFTSMIRDAGTVRWAEPTAVRRRGQQRGRRKAAMAALAAVLVVGSGLGSAWTLRDRWSMPTPPGPPATIAPPTATPSSTPGPGPATLDSTRRKALLWATDVDTDEYEVDETQQGDDHGGLPALMSYCGQSESAAPGHEVSRYRLWVKQKGGPKSVLQEVREYQPTWAQRHLADLRAAVQNCPTVDIMGDSNDRSTLVIVEQYVEGAQLLVVKETRTNATGTSIGYHAIIVKGDLETSLRAHLPGVSTEVVAQMIGTAAERLCQAVNTECDPYASAPPG